MECISSCAGLHYDRSSGDISWLFKLKIYAKKNMYTIPKNLVWADFVKMEKKNFLP